MSRQTLSAQDLRHKRMSSYDMFPELGTGKQLADAGMQQAVDHAEAVHESWADKAYAFIEKYVGYTREPFMAEDVRMASLQVVPEPPSKRAWGLIIQRAAKAKLIRKLGYKAVTNPRAHGTPATLWVRM